MRKSKFGYSFFVCLTCIICAFYGFIDADFVQAIRAQKEGKYSEVVVIYKKYLGLPDHLEHKDNEYCRIKTLMKAAEFQQKFWDTHRMSYRKKCKKIKGSEQSDEEIVMETI